MDENERDERRIAADTVLQLAEELEASGDIKLDDAVLARARAALHAWIDGAVGVVVTPAFGRVTVIHPEGRTATIASAELSMAMSDPVGDWAK